MKETAGVEPAAPLNLDAASDDDRAIALWNTGVSLVKIAAELDLSPNTVRGRLRAAGIDTSRPATWVGLLSASEAEKAFSIDRHTLVDAARAGRVRTRGTSNFYGPTTYLFHPLELAQDITRLRCRHEGCDAIALGASGACEAHGHLYLGARAAGVRRPDIGPKISAAKRGMPRPDARTRLLEHWRTGGAFARGTLELRWITGRAKQRWKGRWAPPGGRKREWSSEDAARVLELRALGWGYGTIGTSMGMTASMVRRIVACEGRS